KAVGDDIDIRCRVADFNSGDGLLGGVPVPEVVDLPEPARSFIAADTVQKVVTEFVCPLFNSRRIREVCHYRRMVSPGSMLRPPASIDPIANRQRNKRIHEESFECNRPGKRRTAVIKSPLTIGEWESSTQQMGHCL